MSHLSIVTSVLIALSLIHPLLAYDLHTECVQLNSVSNKTSFYYRGRCYVDTDFGSAISYLAAQSSCQDMPRGGLAMWMAGPVFEWIKDSWPEWTYSYVGVVFEGTDGGVHAIVTDKLVQFRQDASTQSYPAGSVSDGIVAASTNVMSMDEPFGVVYEHTGGIGTYGDAGSIMPVPHVMCQYEESQRIYRRRRHGHRLHHKTIATAETSSLMECIQTCTNLAICSSFAHSAITNDCQLYMVGPQDVLGLYESDWVVGDSSYGLFEML